MKRIKILDDGENKSFLFVQEGPILEQLVKLVTILERAGVRTLCTKESCGDDKNGAVYKETPFFSVRDFLGVQHY